MLNSFVFKKLRHGYIWRRIFLERLTEPLHLNFISLFISLFGSFRAKVAFDLVVRAPYAFAILKCADEARLLGLKKVTLLEFGVATGAGLLNICKIAEKVTRRTGVEFDVLGFDTGTGMPPPQSYRDHPDLYQAGDFPMNHAALSHLLPANARLIIGEIAQTVPDFLEQVSAEAPIGFISIDVDYYTSTKDTLGVLEGTPVQYLPKTVIYLDDVELESHNSWCGELLAVNEFNDEHELRKIERHAFLRSRRIFRNAPWIDHIFTLHILDHPTRSTLIGGRPKAVITNPYL